MGWTDEDKSELLEQARRKQRPRCPNDNAVIRVQRLPVMGPHMSFHLSCPACEAEANESVLRPNKHFTDEQMRQFAINQTRGTASMCDFCGMRLSVGRKDAFGNKANVVVECDYCGTTQTLETALPV